MTSRLPLWVPDEGGAWLVGDGWQLWFPDEPEEDA